MAFIDRQLVRHYEVHQTAYREGLRLADEMSTSLFGTDPASISELQQLVVCGGAGEEGTGVFRTGPPPLVAELLRVAAAWWKSRCGELADAGAGRASVAGRAIRPYAVRTDAARADSGFEAMNRVNAVVIGAGAAGGIVAKELAVAGLSVVVLERGKWYTSHDWGTAMARRGGICRGITIPARRVTSISTPMTMLGRARASP